MFISLFITNPTADPSSEPCLERTMLLMILEAVIFKRQGARDEVGEFCYREGRHWILQYRRLVLQVLERAKNWVLET
ncbi:hypothetical protein CVT26_003653 [Gymnopilus dilepis]|uniref:Uncharacterized protein n=1 Tax=Gymnopilus dilepis TaxID=231916 RepID=A0A409VSK4_9AGAR|nr:hypothetical protein CVT26_003653 [Gymnopilus dilepis]